jgi:hypothetical protein
MLPYSFAPSCSYSLLFLDLFSVPPFRFCAVLDSSTAPGWVAYTVIWEWGARDFRCLGATCGHLTSSPHPDSVYRPLTAWGMFLNLL